ncbi:hypothetical protein [Kangiella sediminilitoris]|uniref:CopC domain-containing protein n=1 Tax=Kangiella sediminilitoris TaxID=1144748 RepID=A0A1B3BBX4_9GAMM|nr:hypothetical protein [Kangiella sediminilitoris]AOE50283.1 hypothetical protein KS2013_1573 [Kangiella sediminilitoris]
MRKTIFTVSLPSLLIIQPLIAEAEAEQSHHIFVTTNTNQVAEVCPELKAGQTLQFEFEAKNKVEFNLHYHQGENITYPIEPQKLAKLTSSFKAPIDQTYCLMWKGLDNETRVQLQYHINDYTGTE